MKTIDLHVHSYISDGTESPKTLVRLAQKAGLSAFALTDHDTVSGIDMASDAAEGTGLEVIPGIEFSTMWQNKDIHILGYFIEYHASGFQKQLQEFTDARKNRNEKMCARIREYTGFPIHLSELQKRWPDAVITRAHMAVWLLEQGYVNTRQDAFDQYLGDHAPCFVPKAQISPIDAIRLTKTFGGVPVLAHPLLYALPEERLRHLLKELKDAGLQGIEALYSMNKDTDEAFVRSLAQSEDLLITGGSDFHGANRPGVHIGSGRGELSVPYSLLEALRAAR